MAKRENAKGLKDVRKLLQATDDPEDQATLTECVERLQAKARGRQPPQERLEAALVAMADANTRLTRAQKHLVEARNLHLRATEAAETAKQELEVAEQAEEDRRKQEEEEAERRKREAEEASVPSSSVPTSFNTMELHNTLLTLQSNLGQAPAEEDGKVKVDPQHLTMILERLIGLTGMQTASGTEDSDATAIAVDSDSDMGFTDAQIRSFMRRMNKPPPPINLRRHRLYGKTKVARKH